MQDGEIRFIVSAGIERADNYDEREHAGAGAPLVSLKWVDDQREGQFLLDPATARRLSVSLAKSVDALERMGFDIDSSKVRTNLFLEDP